MRISSLLILLWAISLTGSVYEISKARDRMKAADARMAKANARMVEANALMTRADERALALSNDASKLLDAAERSGAGFMIGYGFESDTVSQGSWHARGYCNAFRVQNLKTFRDALQAALAMDSKVKYPKLCSKTNWAFQ